MHRGGAVQSPMGLFPQKRDDRVWASNAAPLLCILPETKIPVEISLILGCGGNSAAPEHKKEASPAALFVKAKHHRKILFSLREEKIGRAQNEKSKEYFSVVRRVSASGGGAASFVGGFPKMRLDFV